MKYARLVGGVAAVAGWLGVSAGGALVGEMLSNIYLAAGAAGAAERGRGGAPPHGRARALHHFHMIDFFAKAHGHAVLLGDIGEGGGDFVIKEWQQGRAFIHDGDAHPKGREHGGVFHADDARANHDEGARDVPQLQNIVADQDALACTVQRSMRSRPGLDDSRAIQAIRWCVLRAAFH